MKYLIPISGLLTIAALTLCMSPASAQQKYEREYSIKGSQIPPDALSFINECFKNARAKWYGEESLTGTTVEAKLKHSGKKYSVEFSTSGELLDIEILTSFRSLPDETKSKLSKRFKEEFRRYKITKTQTQWSGKKELLKAAVLEDKLPSGVVVQYELVLRAKKTGVSKYYEVLSDKEGNVKKISEIIQQNVDNLIY